MKCPKCGGEEFTYTETTNHVLRKKLPIWVGIVGLIVSMILFRYGITNNTCFKIGIYVFIITILYMIIRAIRISQDKAKTVTKRICLNCEDMKYIKTGKK